MPRNGVEHDLEDFRLGGACGEITGGVKAVATDGAADAAGDDAVFHLHAYLGVVVCDVLAAIVGNGAGEDGGDGAGVDEPADFDGVRLLPCRFVGACDFRPVRDGLAVEVEVEEHGLQVGVDGDGRVCLREWCWGG